MVRLSTVFYSIKPILNRVSKTQTKLARMQEQHKGSHHPALNTNLRQVDKFTTELSKGLKDEVRSRRDPDVRKRFPAQGRLCITMRDTMNAIYTSPYPRFHILQQLPLLFPRNQPTRPSGTVPGASRDHSKSGRNPTRESPKRRRPELIVRVISIFHALLYHDCKWRAFIRIPYCMTWIASMKNS